MGRIKSMLPATGYLFAIAVLPILTLPFLGASSDPQKGVLAALSLGTALVALSAIIIASHEGIRVPSGRVVLLGTFLVAVSVVSAFRAPLPEVAWWGIGFETGTVGSILLFIGASLAAASVSIRAIVVVALIFVGATFVAAMHFFLVILLGPGEAFAETSLAGAWPQLSIFLAAALCMSALGADYVRTRTYRAVAVVACGTFAVAFALLFHPAAAIALLLTLLFSSVADFGWPHDRMRISCRAIVILLFVLVFAIGVRDPLLPVSADVRISSALMERIAVPALVARDALTFFFGTGPNTFAFVGDRYRPVEFNATPFWRETFDFPFSTGGTLLVTLGTLGALALALYPASVIGRMSVWMRARGDADKVSPQSIGIFTRAAAYVALFGFAALLLYPVGVPAFLVVGVACGVALRSVPSNISLSERNSRNMLVRAACALPILILAVILLWTAAHQFAAMHAHARAEMLAATGALEEAAPPFSRASALWRAPFYDREAANIYRRLFITTFEREGFTEASREYVAQAVRFLEQPEDWGRYVYANQLERASLYVTLVSLGISDATPRFHEVFAQAHQLSPSRPEPFYLLAIVEEKNGRADKAIDALEEALRLKPDYAEALELLASLRAR